MEFCGIILNYALLYGAVLLLGAISGYLSERAGIVNIGIDGMMCFGVVFFGIFSSPLIGITNMGASGIIFALLFTMIATMITGAMHAFVCINLKANHVISGTAINLIGVAFCTFVNNKFGNIFYDGSSKLLSGFDDFLYVGNSLYGSSIIVFIAALVLVAIIWVIVTKTRVGLRYRAVGENPFAVDAQSISVTKYQWVAVLLSSAVAGLAGGIFLFNIKQSQGNTQGLGYLALAIMIVGAWKIEWITITSIVFSLFMSLCMSNVLTNVGFARELAYTLPYLITFAALIFFARWVRAPEYDGIPFDRNLR